MHYFKLQKLKFKQSMDDMADDARKLLQTHPWGSSWSRVASYMKSSSWESSFALKTYRTSFMKSTSWTNDARPTLYCFGMDIVPLLQSWSKRSKSIVMNRCQWWLEEIRPNNTTPMAVMGVTSGLLNNRRSYWNEVTISCVLYKHSSTRR